MNEEAEFYLQMELDDLYAEIGNSILDERDAFPRPIVEKVAAGKKWSEENWARLKELVCSKSFRDGISGTNNLVTLTIAIADLISAVFLKVSPFAISALIVKIGLDKFCKEDTANKQ